MKLHFKGHTLGWIIMSQEEYDLLQSKIKALEESLSNLREQRGSRVAKFLRDDLGKAMNRIEELKVEVEEWKRLNAKLIEEAPPEEEEASMSVGDNTFLYVFSVCC